MPEKVLKPDQVPGLSTREIPALRQLYGKNEFSPGTSRRLLRIIWDIVKEPMFLLLLIACSLYFILHELNEGIMMLVAMCIVTTIGFYQEVKSSNAINALKEFTVEEVTVIRDDREVKLPAEELVPGDIVLLEEGMNIPADGLLLRANDLSVNESVITGESLPAEKNETAGHNLLYQGTTINSGKCIARVTATGNSTVLGKLGKAVGSYQPPKTLLQVQMSKFVQRFALFGLVGFFIVLFMNYLHYGEWSTSLLFALTLAMSAVPEEIPVAFSSFMALGAYKMSKLGIISRQPQIVENLGAVSVFCFDKTGTLTENKMQLKSIYDNRSDSLLELTAGNLLPGSALLHYAVLASETDPFDPMEKAIWEAYRNYKGNKTGQLLNMVYEYPLEGKPPMMTHVYDDENKKLVAAKGAAERITRVCRLTPVKEQQIQAHINSLASKGYRVLGVASAIHDESALPAGQDEFNWQFEGLLALYDPPKKNAAEVLKLFYEAGIDIKLITGDHPETAMNIAGQVGIRHLQECVSGDEVMLMKEEELKKIVKNSNVFARMFPDAKLKVINAIKANDEIVAMTGDGVNDGPALKAASIGIAMGKKGTEIARQAADLVLTDDNLERLVTAISEGRKIFSNLKKAIRYIISIHIPIILTASLPLLLGWTHPNIFTPVHVIFMELIMGPTCSIFFEREPVEGSIMQVPPREKHHSIFSTGELLHSIVQGLVIAAAVLSLYYYFMKNGASTEEIRTIVFTTLLLSNIFLTSVNRSFTKTVFYTARYKNNLAPVILIISAAFLSAMHFIPAVRNFFQLIPIRWDSFWLCFGVAFASVMWFEVYKAGFLKLGYRR